MPTTVAGRRSNTVELVLDAAERLVQIKGFNGFSYADVAAEVGVTNAALHYHFPSKSDLGTEVIRRYAERFLAALADIDAAAISPSAALQAYVSLYVDVLRDQRMCLCGMLAADIATLPAPMRDEVTRFFDANEAWLIQVIGAGAADGSLVGVDDPRRTARLILSGLEGGMLLARPYHDAGRFETMAEHLVATITPRTR